MNDTVQNHINIHKHKQTHECKCVYQKTHHVSHTHRDKSRSVSGAVAALLLCDAQSYLLLGLKWPFRLSHCGWEPGSRQEGPGCNRNALSSGETPVSHQITRRHARPPTCSPVCLPARTHSHCLGLFNSYSWMLISAHVLLQLGTQMAF